MRIRSLLILVGLYSFAVWHTVAHVAAYELSHGRQVILKHGLQIQSLAHPWPNPPLDVDLWRSANFTTINLTHQAPEVATALGPSWSRYGYIDHPPYDYLSEGEMQIVNNLVSLQYDDERLDFFSNPEIIPKMAARFAEWNTLYPNALAHTNHWGAFMDETQARDFMRDARPDMLMFDTYPSDFDNTREMWYGDMQKYRKVALEGYDGTGNSPIVYGQYLKLYKRENQDWKLHSESFVRAQQFASWAFGYTFVNGFLYNPYPPEYQDDIFPQIFTERDSASPKTTVFDYVAETNRQSRNLGAALVRLVSTDVRMIPATYGTHEEDYWDLNWPFHHWRTVDDNLPLPDGITEWSPGAGGDNYITAITPLGNDNGASHIHGDVLIGYFQPLLEDNPGCTFVDGLHFMIVNGRGMTEEEWWDSPSNTAESLAEWYRLEFDFAGSDFDSLVRLSRETGQVELVTLNPLGGSQYSLALYLEGGTGDLFRFWDSSLPLPTIPEPNVVVLLVTGASAIIMYVYKRRIGKPHQDSHSC